ncbi:hypothetical protein ACFQ3W_17255 [Paenibacillus puldeungensis]|uniref:Uncharacterized protein n=1 Tax=Paenibacillus puldeungensis TaxID=696536 RepID=A0ABW3RZW1_9BACL
MNIVINFRDGSKGLELPSLREVEMTKKDKGNHLRGFYMDYREHRIGIVASPEGPVFFGDGHFYHLKKSTFQFELLCQKTRNIFCFLWKGDVVLKFSYTPVLYQDGGFWRGDAVRDFCMWLVEAVQRNNFYEFYTLRGQKTAAQLTI